MKLFNFVVRAASLAAASGFGFAIAAAQQADLAVVNATVLTVDESFSQAAALAVRDGRFIAVGSNEEVQRLVGEGTRVIDARGRTVIPGLIETHVHATGAARGEARQPFVQLGSIAEIQEWVRQRARETPPGRWILLPRVDVTRIQERRLPTRAELDQAAPDHPVLFNWRYADRQVQVLNSAALRAARISGETRPPPRGTIRLDEQGEPTGVLEDSGQLLAGLLPAQGVAEDVYLSSLERLLSRYNELGITSIFERNSNAAGVRAYQTLQSQNRLPVRVTVTIGLSTDGTEEGTERSIRALPFQYGDGDDWVRVGPLKVGLDGGILYGTAYMREPYGERALPLYGFSDPQYRGSVRRTPEQLINIFRAGHRLGWQMSSHVTGDAGVDAVLDALEAVDRDVPVRDLRYTLIHAYFANEEAARRAARLGVCVDTQPAWFYKDGDALADALGADRLRQFIGVRTWRREGVKVALNSDHMQGFDSFSALNPYNPFLTMHIAITRKTEGGLLIGPEERVSREDALRMMTIEAAHLSFDEDRKGSIEAGKLADFAILSDDFLECPEEKIRQIRAVLTVVGGKVVHEAGSSGLIRHLP